MPDRLSVIEAMIDVHKKSMDDHMSLMHDLVQLLNLTPPDPKPQHIIITGPTTASALAPLPGTELTIFHMIPTHRRLWDQCLATNFRFEPTSFVRLFPTCGHYFWYRHHFEMENGVAMCPQCGAEEQIVENESRRINRRMQIVLPPIESPPSPPTEPPPPPPRSIGPEPQTSASRAVSELRRRRVSAQLPDIPNSNIIVTRDV